MASDLQLRNFGLLFRVWDSNGDGQLEWPDYEAVVDRFEAELGLSAGSEQHSSLVGVFKRDWETLTNSADKDSDGTISLDEWNAYHEQVVSDDEGYRVAVDAFADLMMGLADSDGDGVISRGEYGKILRAFNLDGTRADEAFRKLDTDGDGRISTAELRQAAGQYFRPSSADDAGNWIFGNPEIG